ncbi:helix-turn-helix domain-containing protein [Actinocorallia sp. A-T 12471]|uniref:helix-turn-helix domain-containing protein n=1 Tax=Actinocorallia sp. A-T 12471 TaxID=3089813 RepID=UPI0029CCC8F1|nr:helix-turn-helix domain-containing protein [Actinocorallia sp. A-T 12471]MDX6742763.1 helix-turn-helix domain-containing protein [Actinocorallia sp. A-T 12471]
MTDPSSAGAAFAAGIGRRIRDLRTARGISLSELAQRARVGKATLSALEAGTRNPTVETLYAITAQLGVPLGALLPDPAARPAMPPLHGEAVSGELLETFHDGSWTTELYRLRIRPGRRQISPAHPSGVTEYLTVFQGTALVGPPDAPLVIPAGSHLSWTSDTPHLYATATPEEVHATLLIRHPHH